MATEAEIRRQLREAEFRKYQTQAPEENQLLVYINPVGQAIGTAAGLKGGPLGMALGSQIGGAAGSLIAAPFMAQEEEKKREYVRKLQEEQRRRMLAQGKLMDELARIHARREAMRRMQQQAQSAASIIA